MSARKLDRSTARLLVWVWDARTLTYTKYWTGCWRSTPPVRKHFVPQQNTKFFDFYLFRAPIIIWCILGLMRAQAWSCQLQIIKTSLLYSSLPRLCCIMCIGYVRLYLHIHVCRLSSFCLTFISNRLHWSPNVFSCQIRNLYHNFRIQCI